MSTLDQSGRRDLPVALAVVGTIGFVASIPFGARVTVSAALVASALFALAIAEVKAPVITWPTAIGGLVAIVWFIPIKGYALPIDLPFNLEYYRLAILVLLLAATVALLTKRMTLNAGGRILPIAILAGGALVSQIVNLDAIDAASTEPDTAIKALSYFLSYLIVFVLVCTVLDSLAGIDTVVRTLVGGGTIVAVAAIYEARVGYNVFDHLDQWLPGLERQPREILEQRSGRLRVYASAQHPIGLGVALALVVPMAAYAATRARSVVRARLWYAAAIVLAVGATATISRTIVAMTITMIVVALLLRRSQVLRLWPALLILPVVIHFAAPGSLGGLYKSLFPQEGLVSDLSGRAGEGGSGRLADVGPGITLWKRQPLVGNGLGNEFPSSPIADRQPGQLPVRIIFDNQYLDTLVKLGAIGILGVVLLVWGGAISLFRHARRLRGPTSDLLAACSIGAFGFAAALFFYDAFAFVQGTLVFVMIIALGHRASTLAPPAEPTTGGEIA